MTLNKAVVELGKHDFTRGLTFVAISRVRAIGDIVFRPEIGTERLQILGGSTNLLKEDIIRRAGLNFVDAADAEELEFLSFELVYDTYGLRSLKIVRGMAGAGSGGLPPMKKRKKSDLNPMYTVAPEKQ